jgi:hypothetical protein
MTSTFMTSVFFRHDNYIYDISIFHMTSTLMTSVLFRHNIYIFDFSVFKTWHVQSWHQSFSDMTFTLMTSVSLRQVIYIYNISVFLDVASTFMTFMFFRHDISIDDIRVFHMTSRFMTSVYFTWYQMKPFHLQMDDEDKLIR